MIDSSFNSVDTIWNSAEIHRKLIKFGEMFNKLITMDLFKQFSWKYEWGTNEIWASASQFVTNIVRVFGLSIIKNYSTIT